MEFQLTGQIPNFTILFKKLYKVYDYFIQDLKVLKTLTVDYMKTKVQFINEIHVINIHSDFGFDSVKKGLPT